MSTDAFLGRADGVNSPARSAKAVTPSNSDLAQLPKALWVGGAGDVVALLADDAVEVTFTGVADGTILPIRARRVLPASTATDIVALY